MYTLNQFWQIFPRIFEVISGQVLKQADVGISTHGAASIPKACADVLIQGWSEMWLPKNDSKILKTPVVFFVLM